MAVAVHTNSRWTVATDYPHGTGRPTHEPHSDRRSWRCRKTGCIARSKSSLAQETLGSMNPIGYTGRGSLKGPRDDLVNETRQLRRQTGAAAVEWRREVHTNTGSAARRGLHGFGWDAARTPRKSYTLSDRLGQSLAVMPTKSFGFLIYTTLSDLLGQPDSGHPLRQSALVQSFAGPCRPR